MDKIKHRYIVVEGPIGVGKTSLARLLAGARRRRPAARGTGSNPFLGNFYQDPRRWALATQLFFLFQRVNQLSGLKQLDLFERPTVADFLFDKDPMFARLNLSDDEFALYQRIYEHLAPQAVAPDLVIYLQAPVETLMARVRRRAASYERGISEDYLARLTAGLRALLSRVRRGAAADREQQEPQFC